jgi:hypothetical protein
MEQLPRLTFIGWCVMLLGLYWVSKTKTGHAVIYLALLLILVFLLLQNYKQIDKVILVQGG